jgi:hypothetical protein
MVPNDSRSVVAAFCPIAARRVAARRGIHALRVGAGQHVVGIHWVDAAGHDLPFLGQSGLFIETGVGRVEVINVFGDDDASNVLPRPLPNSVTCVYPGVATRRRRAEIGALILFGIAYGGGERRAMRVRTIEAAKVSAFARADAGEEERHIFRTGRVSYRRRDEQACSQQESHQNRVLSETSNNRHIISSCASTSAASLSRHYRASFDRIETHAGISDIFQSRGRTYTPPW